MDVEWKANTLGGSAAKNGTATIDPAQLGYQIPAFWKDLKLPAPFYQAHPLSTKDHLYTNNV